MNLISLRHTGALFATAALVLALGACKTDLDPNDSYTETTFIYAVLDANQPVQRISINKAFLNTNTNAITIAANRPDSVTFPAGVIQASIEILNKRDSSLIGSPYPLEPKPNTGRSEGPFARTGQLLYQTPAGFPQLQASDTTKLYKVVARNLRTGTEASGVTTLPITRPNTQPASFPYLYFRAAGFYLPATQLSQVLKFDPGQTLNRVSVHTQPRAGVYSIDMDFHYKEVLPDGTETRKTLTWALLTNERKAYDPFAAELVTNFPENAFFTQFLNQRINPATDPPGLRRVLADTAITWRATAGSVQWARYQEIMSSSSALTQTTPDYTNVRGGRGLVTGRAHTEVYQYISLTTLTNAASRQYFRDLRFQ